MRLRLSIHSPMFTVMAVVSKRAPECVMCFCAALSLFVWETQLPCRVKNEQSAGCQAHNAHITQRGVCPLINNVSRISDE